MKKTPPLILMLTNHFWCLQTILMRFCTFPDGEWSFPVHWAEVLAYKDERGMLWPTILHVWRLRDLYDRLATIRKTYSQNSLVLLFKKNWIFQIICQVSIVGFPFEQWIPEKGVHCNNFAQWNSQFVKALTFTTTHHSARSLFWLFNHFEIC